MMKHRILLTGGTGFFGKSILSAKRRGGFSDSVLTVLSRSPEQFCRQYPDLSCQLDVEFIRGDVRNFAFPKGDFDFVLHGAAPTTVESGSVYRDTIINGTERVLEFSHSKHVRRMLFVSSGAVYAKNTEEDVRISETFPLAPTTEYGIAKLEAEKRCLASEVPVVIARCFSFVGPYLAADTHLAIGQFIQDCLNGRPITLQSSGRSRRAYLYADDLTEWLEALLFEGSPGNIYNVGSDQGLTILELAETVRDLLVPVLPVAVRPGDDPDMSFSCYVPDVSKVRRQLGLKIRTTLREAILKSVQERGGRPV